MPALATRPLRNDATGFPRPPAAPTPWNPPPGLPPWLRNPMVVQGGGRSWGDSVSVRSSLAGVLARSLFATESPPLRLRELVHQVWVPREPGDYFPFIGKRRLPQPDSCPAFGAQCAVNPSVTTSVRKYLFPPVFDV